MTTVNICDRCGKHIDENMSNAQIISWKPQKPNYHLCNVCFEEFESWLTRA